ncbi:HTH-Tnp-Tc5 domain containing protein, partial [Pyrenophora tritici-repentis]
QLDLLVDISAYATKAFNQRILSPQEEFELIIYIEGLTIQGLPPTREMVQKFASTIAKIDVGKTWITRFLSRNSGLLTVR